MHGVFHKWVKIKAQHLTILTREGNQCLHKNATLAKNFSSSVNNCSSEKKKLGDHWVHVVTTCNPILEL